MLTASEEAALIRRAQHGDKRARDKLAREFQPFCSAYARSYAGGRVDEDLQQEAACGLVKAIDTFDFKRKTRLATHARSWCRHYVGPVARRRGYAVTVPLQRRPSSDEVLAELTRGSEPIETDELPGDAPLPDATTVARAPEQAVALLMQQLTDAERAVIRRRLAGDNLRQIADVVGLTPSRVQQIESNAIACMTESAKRLRLRPEDCL